MKSQVKSARNKLKEFFVILFIVVQIKRKQYEPTIEDVDLNASFVAVGCYAIEK